jgi:5-methylcytosine-specific restriction endonuclease McrA
LAKKRPVRYYSAKRRAVYAKGDQINHLLLFELHNWKCYVCREPINRRLRMPNYFAATVEHIVPLCKGGTHTWDNVVPAHAKCNFDKGDSLPDEFSAMISA